MTLRLVQQNFLKLQASCVGISVCDGKEDNHKLIVLSPIPFISMKLIFLYYEKA